MRTKFWIDSLSLFVPATYLIITFSINISESAKFSSLPKDIDVSLFADSTSAALSNIVSDPVVNLKLVNASEGCSSGVSPTLFKWETVLKYCHCQFTVFRTHCSRWSGCKNHSRVTIPFNRWKGKLFCLDKLKPEDWKLSQRGSFPCPVGFKLCKGGVCVRDTILECPITDIVVSPTQPITPEGTYENATFFTEGNSIFISRDLDKTPLVTLTAGIPSTPCINTRVYPKRTNGNSYRIIQIQPEGCEASGNYGVDHSSHVPLDTDSEWNFHSESNMDYFNGLPFYREYVGEEKVTLFARKKIEFKTNKDVCLSFDYRSLKDISNDLSILETIRLVANIFVFILCSIAILTFLIMGLSYCLCKKGGLSVFTITNNVFAIIIAVTLIILYKFAVSYVSAIDSNSTLMKDLAAYDCFKIEGYNMLFDHLQNYMLASFPSAVSHNTANFVLSVLCLIAQFLLLVIGCICRCSKKDYDRADAYVSVDDGKEKALSFEIKEK